MAKITLATVKKFIRENRKVLFIQNNTAFDGMVDGLVPCDKGFRQAVETQNDPNYTLGVTGAYFIPGSRNYFSEYNQNGFKGFRVSNCCGSFILAVQSVVVAA